MKSKYLEDLSDLLVNYNMDKSEIDDILSDYSEMYDSWIEKGYFEDEIQKKLGNPKTIIKDLTEGYRRISKPEGKSDKITALTPFIATIAYFILGFGFDLWHPGWAVYLIIPMTAIIMNVDKEDNEHLTTALSPFIASITYFILGFGFDLWHPGWMVFLIIPMLGIWNSKSSMRFIDLITSLSPFIALITYTLLRSNGFGFEVWLIFLIIPMLGILNHKNKKAVFLWEFLLIAGVIGYLYIGITYDDFWQYAWLALVPFVLFSIYMSEISKSQNMTKEYRIIVILSALAFLAVGYFFNAWVVAWLFFLAIPVYAIIKETGKKEKIIALSPFVALTLFMLVGHYADLWHLSWIFFLIIPMTAIIKNT